MNISDLFPSLLDQIEERNRQAMDDIIAAVAGGTCVIGALQGALGGTQAALDSAAFNNAQGLSGAIQRMTGTSELLSSIRAVTVPGIDIRSAINGAIIK